MFTATYSDSSGITDFSNVGLLFNQSNSLVNGCYATDFVKTNALYLANNAAGLIGPISPGSSSTLTNSQCTLSGMGSSVSTSGNNLSVSYSLTFNGSFSGVQQIYLADKSVSGVNTGGVNKGSWTP